MMATCVGFQREQSMPEVDWTTLALRRTAGPQSLAGRDAIRQTLVDMSFSLL